MSDSTRQQTDVAPHGQPATDLPDHAVPHVLLIEDDDQMRGMLSESLENAGYRITECPDAFHWMDFCVGNTIQDQGQRYDVVVSDIRMPGVSGLDVLEGLANSHHCPPTILITAFGDEPTHRRAHALGAAAILDKPFAVQDLLKAIRAALDGTGAVRQAAQSDQRETGGPTSPGFRRGTWTDDPPEAT